MKIIDRIVGSAITIFFLVKLLVCLYAGVHLVGVLIENGLLLQILALIAGLHVIAFVVSFVSIVAWDGFLWLLGGVFRLIESAFDWWAYTAIPKMGDWLTDSWDFIETRVKS